MPAIEVSFPREVIVIGSWLNRFFLAGVSLESYVVQKKALLFTWISIIVIPLLVIPTVLNLTTAVSTHPAAISIANVLLIIGFIAALIGLRNGRFDLAVTLGILFVSLRVIVGALMKLDTWIATGNNNNVYFMFGALAFTAFFGTRRQQLAMALVFIAINIGVVIFALAIAAPGINLLIGSTINVVIALIITMSLSWLISFITELSLNTTEEELRKNIALGKVLEEKIKELHERSVDLIEANKNLMIYKNFAEASGQGLGMSLIDGTVIYANHALVTLLGKKNADALLEKRFIDNYPPEVKSTVNKEIVPKVLQEGQWVGELPLLSDSGGIIPAIQNIFLMRDAEGKPLYLALVVTDLTERKQMEMKLLMAQKMEAVGKLAGGIVHDLNNMLTAIMGFSEVLLRDLDPKDPRRGYVEEIKRSGKMSSGIIRQLLAFGKNQIIKITDFDLNAEIDSLCKILRRLIREDIKTVIELFPEPLLIHADPTQVGQIIINLVINASDAIPDTGRIVIRTARTVLKKEEGGRGFKAAPGEYAMLTVEDNGIGMDEETKNHLFEPFFSTKEPEKGSGLGLSVVYSIVRQYNGWISVTSERGAGTTFDVYLPLKREKERPDDLRAPSMRERLGKGEKILVVEDQDKVRTFAATILRANNYSVFEAGSAEEAEEIFNNEKGNIDLLFTDVVLPGKGGLRLIDILCGKKKDLPVLLASGYTEQRSLLDIIEQRRYILLHKPYSMDELLDRVAEMLRGRK